MCSNKLARSRHTLTLVSAVSPTRLIIGHIGDNFYRSDDQTNSGKALNEATKIGFSPTRTNPPCYNVKQRHPPLDYAQHKEYPMWYGI